MICTRIVYVIGSAESPVKIGVASSLPHRLYDLQIGNPDPLVCHHFVRLRADRAAAVEQAAHATFKDRHRRGEWFDIDWREAARVLEELAAIERDVGATTDFLWELQDRYSMKPQGRAAVWDYLDRQDRAEPYVAHANGYILKKVGTASYAAFSLIVAQQKELSGLKPPELEAARRALAQAINALCEFRRIHGREKAGADHRRLVAQITDPKAAIRPPSLPPVGRVA